MNIEEMNIEELEARSAEIISELEAADETRTAELDKEADAINARKEELRKAEAEKKEERKEVTEMAEVIAPVVEKRTEQTFDASSPEYRTAWLKNLAVRGDGKKLFGEMTEIEQRAYQHTTSNSSALVPTEIANRIVELVQSMAPMYDDATKSGITKGFAIVRHTAIAAGDAAATTEGVANDDEQDTFTQLELAGVEIKKHIRISRKLEWQSIDAFESWVVDHIAKRIAVAKEAQIITRLDSTSTGIASANIITGASGSEVDYTDEQVRTILALIKETGTKVWYANSNTIYTGLAAIQDSNGRPLFLNSTTTDDPLVAGRIYGGIVKVDENLSDDVVYVGVPKSIIANDFEALYMQRTIDSTSFETVVAGYSLFDAGLENPYAFVKCTFYPTVAEG